MFQFPTDSAVDSRVFVELTWVQWTVLCSAPGCLSIDMHHTPDHVTARLWHVCMYVMDVRGPTRRIPILGLGPRSVDEFQRLKHTACDSLSVHTIRQGAQRGLRGIIYSMSASTVFVADIVYSNSAYRRQLDRDVVGAGGVEYVLTCAASCRVSRAPRDPGSTPSPCR